MAKKNKKKEQELVKALFQRRETISHSSRKDCQELQSKLLQGQDKEQFLP